MAREKPAPPPHQHNDDCYTYVPNCPRMEHRHQGSCFSGSVTVCPVIEHTHSVNSCTRKTLTCGQ